MYVYGCGAEVAARDIAEARSPLDFSMAEIRVLLPNCAARCAHDSPECVGFLPSHANRERVVNGSGWSFEWGRRFWERQMQGGYEFEVSPGWSRYIPTGAGLDV